MNGYNFTERVRKVLMLAREEATALRHEYVGTEHILLGLCSEAGGVAVAALENLDVHAADVRQAVLQTVKPGPGVSTVDKPSESILGTIAETIGLRRADHDLPYTSRAKRVLELAMTETRELNHSYVGTEHLLLGLMREEKGIAAQVLTMMGMTVPAVRGEVLRLLGTEMPPKGAATEGSPPRAADAPAAITLVVEHPDGRVEARKFRHTHEAVRYLNGLEY